MCTLHNHPNNAAGGEKHSCTPWYRKPYVIAAFVIAAALAAYLWIYHQRHVLSALPLLLFLACPLMHIFGHRHGHGADDQPGQVDKPKG